VIKAAPMEGVLAQAQTGQFEEVMANFTDPVFGLPGLVTLDARTGMQDVAPALLAN
jgi:hypothetical protein